MRNKSIVSITTIAGTMENFVLESMEYMQLKGWDVTLMCNTKEHPMHRDVPKGMRYVHVPMERSFNLITAIKCIRLLIKEFRKTKPTLVQYGTTHAALFGSIASWVTRVPIRIHLQWGIYNYDEMGFVGKFYWFVEWLTCKLSTDIRPVSHKNLQVALDEHLFKPGKGKVLGQGGTIGVDLTQYPLDEKAMLRNQIRERLGIDVQKYVYGFVGRISRDKGNNELIKAFREIESNSNVVLLLLGANEGSIDKSLQEWADNCPKVIFTGRVNHDDIPKYLAAMDVLVHPTYREGFGMVLQEAMAMEVPIITTNIPGPSEVIEEGVSGVLVPSHDAVALGDAMNEFYEHQEKYKQYGKNGRIRVEKYFDRPVMIENIFQDKEELYNSFINNKKH